MSDVNSGIQIAQQAVATAGSFLNRIAGPAIDEYAQMFKDDARARRVNREIDMLVKTQEKVDRLGIKIKGKISLKLLVPLLDYSSLEEDDYLKDKWSSLLSNLVDSEQNIQNHVFPYILSQISKKEFETLEIAFQQRKARDEDFNRQIEEWKLIKDESIKNAKEDFEKFRTAVHNKPGTPINALWEKKKELESIQEKENALELQRRTNNYKLVNEMAEFETANLLRLGLIKHIMESYGYLESGKVRGTIAYDEPDLYVNETEVIINSENIYDEMTQLGVLFMDACTEKKIK